MQQSPPEAMPRWLVNLLAVAVGVSVANLYYAQPLAGLIGRSLGLAPEAAGLVVMLTQIGYGLGVLLIVPLGDIVETRRLVITMIVVTVLGLLGLSYSTLMIPYFGAALATGLGASTVQIIVPYAAHFTPPERRGRVIGQLMSGLMLGIMLSRPIASLLTDLFNWHAVFVLSASLMTALAVTLYFLLPPRAPSSSINYPRLLLSMAELFRHREILRRRAIYQACLFGSFCLFWTAAPLLLSGAEFHLSQTALAVFALVGVSGAVSAPFAGRAADRGWSRPATGAAMILSAVSFLLPHLFTLGTASSLASLVVGAILLDAGITANLVLGQRAIFSLERELHSRLNGLYIATIFVGGAAGSALGGFCYARGGWALASLAGFCLPAAALVYFLTERNREENGTPRR